MISSVSAYATYNNQIQENTTKHATNDEDVVITAPESASNVETEQATLPKGELVSCSEIGKMLSQQREVTHKTFDDGTQVSIEPEWSVDEIGNKTAYSASLMIKDADGTVRSASISESGFFVRDENGKFQFSPLKDAVDHIPKKYPIEKFEFLAWE